MFLLDHFQISNFSAIIAALLLLKERELTFRGPSHSLEGFCPRELTLHIKDR